MFPRSRAPPSHVEKAIGTNVPCTKETPPLDVRLRLKRTDHSPLSYVATDVTSEVYATASALFGALGLQRARIRLVGVRVEGLVPRETVHRQLHLGEREHGWAEADRAVDRAVSRFGSAAVRPATLLSGDRP